MKHYITIMLTFSKYFLLSKRRQRIDFEDNNNTSFWVYRVLGTILIFFILILKAEITKKKDVVFNPVLR